MLSKIVVLQTKMNILHPKAKESCMSHHTRVGITKYYVLLSDITQASQPVFLPGTSLVKNNESYGYIIILNRTKYNHPTH